MANRQFAILNAVVDSGIPRESATQRVGISPERVPRACPGSGSLQSKKAQEGGKWLKSPAYKADERVR
jgi:hypothetical protein